MSALKPPSLPMLPIVAISGLLLLAMGIVVTAPGPNEGPLAPTAPVVAERTLTFVDRADHAVAVIENGQTVAVFEGEQGFIRGILRGMYRTRRGRDIPRDAPFHLAAYADGRLLLDDPATGIRLDMAAYGPTNEEVFAGLMPRRASGAAR